MMFHTLGAVKNAIGIGEDEPELRLNEEKQITRYCHRIIASTEREKNALRRYYDVSPEKVSVIPCGVNLDLFRPEDKLAARKKLGLGDGKIILCVGRVERLKGIDKIIQALPYLDDTKPKLLIVGEDGNRPGEIDKLKDLASELAVSDRITFTGLVDYEKLADYYNAADVCVFPSYYESFGLVPLESLACGTPVIATDVGDLKHIIRQGETGYVLADNQPATIAEKVRTVLAGSPSGIVCALAIRASVAGYSWPDVAAALYREFSRIVNKETAAIR
jgi:D-inositol-3-phosphate glycosyltransferase